MKKLLLILLCLPLLFSSCKKEENNEVVIEPISLNNAWNLNVENNFLEEGIFGGNYIDGNTNIVYANNVNESLFLSNTIQHVITSGESTVFKSRVWSFNESLSLIETYVDYNDITYNDEQHSYLKKSDTLEINFQNGNTQKFLINKLDINELQITSIQNDTTISPIFNINGVYQDSIMYHITSTKYYFLKQ
jgi:hypothetical protein